MLGETFFFERGSVDIVKNKVQYPTAEIERFELAVKETLLELQELCEKARQFVGEENAAIFEMQKLIAMDDLLIDEVKSYIMKNSCNGEYALLRIANDYAGKLELLEDEMMRARAADCLDVSRRMLKHMTGVDTVEPVVAKPVILLAKDLSPSETVNLDKEKILAIVLQGGSEYSHMAILAKSLGIPCLVQTEIPSLAEIAGKEAVVDGREGRLYVEPSPEIRNKLEEEQKQIRQKRENLKQFIGLENRTADGTSIEVFANIETPADLIKVIEMDAGGIGLFRTEFLYLSRDIYPEEEEQFTVYRHVITGMHGKPVVIRTLDMGADKTVPYIPFSKEENPAMGMRGIRLCLQQKQLFLTQIKALLRASVYGNVSIMFPMITSLWEVEEIKGIIGEAKQFLTNEGKDFGTPKLGIMIETPAAVMIAEELAKQVDFFSIGTNDLTQYVLATDRMNPAMTLYTNPYHDAVKRMIEITVESAHRANIKVGICGELASDETMTEYFLRIGVDELSVPAGEILSLRKKIRSLDLKKSKG